MGALIVAGVVGAVVGAVLVSAGVWLLRSRRAPAAAASPDRQAAARMARDIGVLTEALADRLAAVWKAGGGPPAGDPDSVPPSSARGHGRHHAEGRGIGERRHGSGRADGQEGASGSDQGASGVTRTRRTAALILWSGRHSRGGWQALFFRSGGSYADPF